MTSTSSIQRTARPSRRQSPMHLFTVGQVVRMKGGFARPALPADIYHITGTLPPRGDSLQYRIRNDGERHERVTTQEDLEPVSILQSGSSLIERRSAMAKGQKRSNREIRKPKQDKAQPKPESTFGNQIKLAANASAPRGKG